MTLPELPGGYRWDAKLRRYRDTRGRIVPRSTIRAAIDTALGRMDRRAAALSLELRAGSISLVQWETGMRVLVKDVQLFSAAAVRGGFDRMTPGDYGRVGQFVRTQYGYLEGFATELANGKQPLNGFFLNRAGMYAEQGRVTYEAFTQSDQRREARLQGGRLEARNILHPAEHCSVCPALSARGWVPEEEMSLPGTRPCRSRCKCSLERRLVQATP